MVLATTRLRSHNVKQLHKAAARRAYCTLAQGFGGYAFITALVAVFTDPQTAKIAIFAALGTTLATAFGSFWQGVAAGLPEAPKVVTIEPNEGTRKAE